MRLSNDHISTSPRHWWDSVVHSEIQNIFLLWWSATEQEFTTTKNVYKQIMEVLQCTDDTGWTMDVTWSMFRQLSCFIRHFSLGQWSWWALIGWELTTGRSFWPVTDQWESRNQHWTQDTQSQHFALKYSGWTWFVSYFLAGSFSQDNGNDRSLCQKVTKGTHNLLPLTVGCRQRCWLSEVNPPDDESAWPSGAEGRRLSTMISSNLTCRSRGFLQPLVTCNYHDNPEPGSQTVNQPISWLFFDAIRLVWDGFISSQFYHNCVKTRAVKESVLLHQWCQLFIQSVLKKSYQTL